MQGLRNRSRHGRLGPLDPGWSQRGVSVFQCGFHRKRLDIALTYRLDGRRDGLHDAVHRLRRRRGRGHDRLEHQHGAQGLGHQALVQTRHETEHAFDDALPNRFGGLRSLERLLLIGHLRNRGLNSQHGASGGEQTVGDPGASILDRLNARTRAAGKPLPEGLPLGTGAGKDSAHSPGDGRQRGNDPVADIDGSRGQRIPGIDLGRRDCQLRRVAKQGLFETAEDGTGLGRDGLSPGGQPIPEFSSHPEGSRGGVHEVSARRFDLLPGSRSGRENPASGEAEHLSGQRLGKAHAVGEGLEQRGTGGGQAGEWSLAGIGERQQIAQLAEGVLEHGEGIGHRRPDPFAQGDEQLLARLEEGGVHGEEGAHGGKHLSQGADDRQIQNRLADLSGGVGHQASDGGEDAGNEIPDPDHHIPRPAERGGKKIVDRAANGL